MGISRVFSICPLKNPLRLDLFLHAIFPHVSRRDQVALFETRAIEVNGRSAKKSDRVKGGEEIALKEAALRLYEAHALSPSRHIPLRVLYEDQELFALDKPAGISTLPLRWTDTESLANGVIAKWPALAQVGDSPFDVGLLQRLDRETSGIVMGAKSKAAWHAFREASRKGLIEKGYLALVEGEMDSESGAIDLALESRSKHSPRVRVREGEEGDSVTHFTCVGRAPGASLLEISIDLGFRHQIRAHLSAIGHPIVGDLLYGAKPVSGFNRHFLHAHRIRFSHPKTGECLSLESPLPRELREVIGVSFCGHGWF